MNFARLAAPTVPVAVMLGALLLAPAPKARAAPSEPNAEAILDVFQAKASLARAVPAIEAALAKAKVRRGKSDPVPAEREAEIMGLVRRIYPASNLYKIFVAAYAKHLPAADLAPVYKWVLTPAGIRLKQALAAAHAAGPSAPWTYSVRGIKANRRNALKTYVSLSEQQGYFTAWETGAELAVERILNAYEAPDDRIALEDIQKSITARQADKEKEAAATAFAATAFLLKDLKNEDVDELTKFAATVSGLAHAQAMRAALEATLASAAATLEAQIAKPAPKSTTEVTAKPNVKPKAKTKGKTKAKNKAKTKASSKAKSKNPD